MAQRKMLAPNVRIDWIPEVGLTNPAAPAFAELNAGSNISCAIVVGYTLGPTDPDTDDTRSICDNANVENPTFDNYEGTLPAFRNKPGTSDTPVFTTFYNLFKNEGARGYLVRRVGKGNSAAYAAGDIVEVFLFESDVPGDIESDTGGPIQITVPLLAQGFYSGFVTLA